MKHIRTAQLPTLAVVTLVLLRIGIGWQVAFDGFARIRGPGAHTVQAQLERARGPLQEPGRRVVENEALLGIANAATSWGTFALGLLFLLGFLTRTTGFCLIALLLLSYLADPPFAVHFDAAGGGISNLANENLIGILAILAVMASGVSRRSGLDMLLARRRSETPATPASGAKKDADVD